MPELTMPIDIKAPDGSLVARFQMGGAAGAECPTLILHRGDLINVRNIQGGVEGDLNLDLSAGGEGRLRGAVSIQWDNGSDTTIYDGKKKSLMRLYGSKHTVKAVHSDVRHYFHEGAYVPRPGGGWEKL